MLEAFLECLVIHYCLYLRVWIIFKNLVVPVWVWVGLSGLVDFTVRWMDRELLFWSFCPKFCLPLIPLGHSVFPEENFPASSLGWGVRDGRWDMSWLLPFWKLSWKKAEDLSVQCAEFNLMKRPRCWKRLKAKGEGDDRGWDGWIASPTRWTWVWVSSGSWWWTGKPGVL